MSTLGMSANNNNGGSSFKEFKKQASFFLKEKIKSARLALTDVTPAELLTEEATNGNPWAPDTRTLKMISKAAFEVDDYSRILHILHNRLARFNRNNWRVSYHALIVVEHLLTHGPESVADEFQTDKEVIREMGNFQYIDEKGFNWGINIRKKSEKLINLLDKGPLLKEERDRARKVSRGIQGFGSFSQRTSSAQGVLQESSFARSDSQFIKNGDHENQFSSSNDKDFDQTRLAGLQENTPDENVKLMLNDNTFVDNQKITDVGTQTSYFKENVASTTTSEHIAEDTDTWDSTGDSKPLLGNNEDDSRLNVSVEDHPFDDDAQETNVSLLSTTYTRAQAC